MISFKNKGDFSKTFNFLEKSLKKNKNINWDVYGTAGVEALKNATPVDTYKTCNSWYYKIEKNQNSVKLSFHNSNLKNGIPIAILLQYGHGTKGGSFISGRDYINPAIRPVFDKIAKDIWTEVCK